MNPESLAPDLHDIYEALMSSLSRTFLDEMHKNAAKYYLTAGSEGEIYKLKTATGDFIIAKRRYDSVRGMNGTNNECVLQEAARALSANCPGVAVPKIFSRIPDPEEGWEYVLMECVEGKTLWTLALETIANAGKLAQGSLGMTNEKDPIKRFYEERAGYEIQFDNDTEAELQIIEHYRAIAEERGSPDPGLRVRGPDGGVSYPNLKKYIDEDLAKLQIFDKDAVSHIAAVLRPFLLKMHENGIYHRDLNVRNLMIGKNGKVYVIDFGKGVKAAPRDDSVYHAQEGKYDHDLSILELVRSYGPKAMTVADHIKAEAEKAKSGVRLERVLKAAELFDLDYEELYKTVARINMKYGEQYFARLFEEYAFGTAERSHPSTFINPKAKKPEAVASTTTGKRQLLAYLLLADEGVLENLEAYFAKVRSELEAGTYQVSRIPKGGRHPVKVPISGAKADKALKIYLPVFEDALVAAMESAR